MGKTKRINLLKKSSLPHTVAAKPKPENPFDKFANARKKHDILNRKVKGEDRNVGRARAKAIDERKKKLLLDFKQSKRSNQIVDKRFGENDPGMSPEEKMFLRFQRERVKKVRNSSIYNLDEEKTEFLTHRGSILGESNIQDEEWRSDDDEETNGKIHKDVVNKLHFGGGLVPKKTQEQDLPEGSNKPSHFEAMMESLGADNTMKKSRLDALQEIVMKSKFYKMQRKEAKEEQESERKRLDAAFEELFSSHAIEYEDKKPKKKKIDFNDLLSSLRSGKGEDAEEDSGDEEKGNADEDEEADDYDRVMKEMMFEPKVQPSDRMKTAEEIAVANKEKLEELEKARLRRMKRSSMDARDLEDLKQTNKRKRNDDELDDIDFGNDRRNKMKQVQMNQNRVDEDDQDSELNDEDEFDSENDIDEEDEDEIDSDEDDEEEEEEEDDEDLEGDEDDLEDEDDLSDDIDDEDDMEDEDDEDDAEEEEEFPKKRNRRRRGNEGDDNDLPSIEPVVREQFDEMPHKMPCPTDIHAFDDMIHQYCRSSDDRIELVRRIITWNNVHLPGNEGKENKRVIHNFLNILVKYFIRLGDSIPSCKTEEQLQDLWKELNALTGNIFQVTQDLQKNAIPLLSRSLKIIDEQFQKSIRDYQIGQHSSCLLSFGKLLFFQLIAHLFSVTDLENHIVNISILILTQQLTQCPMNNLEEIYLGVITCQILLSSYNSSETKRIMPEVISFLSSTLLCFVPKLHTLFPETAERGKSDSLQSNLYYNRSFYQSYKHYVLNNFKYSQLGHVRQNLASSVKGEDSKKDKRSTGEIMKEVFTNSSIQWKLFTPIDSLDNRVELAEQILLLVYRLIVDYVVPYYSSYNAFPELVHPLQQILQQLAPHQSPVLSHSLQAIHYEALQSIILSIQSVEENRKPLRWREKQLNTVEAKTPKYHINYIIKRDREEYDQENKERSQLKQLTRQLKREQKAAMRELRRDADFIEQERYKEKQVKFEKLRNERFKNFQWLEEQQATINEQVKKGKGLLKGGGSSVAKKPRIRR